MNRIVIVMDGGLIQNIISEQPVEIYTVDYDIEGVDEDHPMLTKLSGDDCLIEPCEPEIHEHYPLLVARTYKTI